MIAALRRQQRRYWFEFEISTAKLALFRVCFFGILALDALMQIENAARYGAGGFNVSHLPWLDAVLPVPSRPVMLTLFVVQSYLALRVALGVAMSTSVKLLTALYAYSYFISQLDSYQHHYLIFLLLVVCCFIPWDQLPAVSPAAAPSSKKRGGKHSKKRGKKRRAAASKQAAQAAQAAAAVPGPRSWAVRLLLVQVAILYGWTSVAKLDPQWLDGAAMSLQAGGLGRRLIESWFGAASAGDPGGFAVAAKLVLATELFLMVALLWRRLWPVALVLGVGLHLGIQFSGFRIGLFSYFMCALYTLLLPERIAASAAATLAPLAKWSDRSAPGWLSRGTAAALLGLGAALLFLLPYQERLLMVAVLAVLGAASLLDSAQSLRRRVVLQLAACAALVLLHGASNPSFNYYKWWGESSVALGDDVGTKAAFSRLIEISDWGPARYHLGNAYRATGDDARALELYREAQERSPGEPGAFAAEAALHAAAGRPAKAREAAHKALQIDPEYGPAQSVIHRLR